MKENHLSVKIVRYMLALVCPLFLWACSEDGIGGDAGGDVKSVRITVRTRANESETENPTEQRESEIRTLRIYVFKDNSELVGYTFGDYSGISQTESTLVMKLPAGNLSFFAIANEATVGELKKENAEIYALPGPTDGTEVNLKDLGRQISPEILQSLTFSELPEAEYIEGGDIGGKDEMGKIYHSPYLPMTGLRIQHVVSNSSVNISLTRSVAKMKLYFSMSGVGECYMGRGLYLYNEPKFGYLFPRDIYRGEIDRREATVATRPAGWESNSFYNDSYVHQLNGRVILGSGWPEEPETYGESEHEANFVKLDINKIEADVNDPGNPQYDLMPEKSFYLFANSNRIGEKPAVTAARPEGDGYYLKILVHQHGAGQSGAELHKGEVFYLSMPAVDANDRISVYSVVTLDGHIDITPHWLISEWQTGGGEIEFN